MNRVPHLVGIAVDEHGADLVLEVVRQQLEQPRRLEPRPRLLVVQHPIEQQAGGVDVGVRARLRQEAHHRGADREVGELAQRLDAVQRVDARVVRDVEQRLRADGQLGVVEELFDQRLDGLVVGLVEDADGFGADVAGRVLQQAADGGMRVRAARLRPAASAHTAPRPGRRRSAVCASRSVAERSSPVAVARSASSR